MAKRLIFVPTRQMKWLYNLSPTIILKSMRSTINTTITDFQNVLERHKTRLKRRSSKVSQPDPLKQPSPIVTSTFSEHKYPFPEDISNEGRLLKTTISGEMQPDRVSRVTKLSHPSLINISKISRVHPKTAPNAPKQLFYAFYFENVPFSLKKAVSDHGSHHPLIFQLAKVNLQHTLTVLSRYLSDRGIDYCYRLDDIGVTRQGQIKVYISPLKLCGISKSRRGTKPVKNSIKKLANWLQTTLLSNEILHPKKSQIQIPTAECLDHQSSISHSGNKSSRRQSFIDRQQPEKSRAYQPPKQMRISDAKQSIIKGLTLKNSTKSYESELQLMKAKESEKMLKINSQIQQIRERLKIRKRKESDSIIERKRKRQVQETQRRQQMKSSDQFNGDSEDDRRVEPPSPSRFRDSFQQNIQCINIFNQGTASSIAPIMNTQPVISYTFIPDSPLTAHTPPPQPQTRPVSPPRPASPPRKKYLYEDDNDSVDTYEKELDYPNEPISIQHSQYRNTMHNPDPSTWLKEDPDPPKPQPTSPKNQNQVVPTSGFTESAGPLQFKKFVNTHIKPRFLSKKSNIWQDPLEYESDEGESSNRRQQGIVRDLNSYGRTVEGSNSRSQHTISINQYKDHTISSRRHKLSSKHNRSQESGDLLRKTKSKKSSNRRIIVEEVASKEPPSPSIPNFRETYDTPIQPSKFMQRNGSNLSIPKGMIEPKGAKTQYESKLSIMGSNLSIKVQDILQKSRNVIAMMNLNRSRVMGLGKQRTP